MKTRPKDKLQCLEFGAMRRNQPRERERTANKWGGTPGAWQARQKHVLRRELTVCFREQSTMRTDVGVNKAKVTGDPDPSCFPWSAKGEKSDWNRFWEDVERCSVVGEVRHPLRRFSTKPSGDPGWRLDAASSEMRSSQHVCVLLLIWHRAKTWSCGAERRVSGILLLWKSLWIRDGTRARVKGSQRSAANFLTVIGRKGNIQADVKRWAKIWGLFFGSLPSNSYSEPKSEAGPSKAFLPQSTKLKHVQGWAHLCRTP